MRLNLVTIGTLWRAEIRMVQRDWRALITAVALPLLLMPLVLFASSWTQRERVRHHEETVKRYAVTGSQAGAVRGWLAAGLAGDEASGRGERGRFTEHFPDDPMAALMAGDLDLVVLGSTAAEDRERAEAAAATGRIRGGTAVAGAPVGDLAEATPVVRLVYRADREASVGAMHRLAQRLREGRATEREDRLGARGFPVAPVELAVWADRDLTADEGVGGRTLGRVLTLFLVVLLLPSAAVMATDSLAGEKERGTLETLLTTAAGRVEIILAKHLAILAVAVAITLLQALNLLVYVGLGWLPLPAGLAGTVTPGLAAWLAVLHLPLAALVAGVLLLASGWASSYKEAQLYFLPIFLVMLVPAVAPFLPGASLHSLLVGVPVANLALATRELLSGTFDWRWIGGGWLVTAGAAAGLLWMAVRTLSAERLVMGDGSGARAAGDEQSRFERQVWRWFAGLWAVLLVVSGYYTESTDLRMQILINVVGLFFGMSVLVMWRYRLEARTVLALRTPRPGMWLAVAAGVPGGLVTGIGLFRLVDRVIPIPAEVLEAFSRVMLSGTIPLWQMFLFLAVLPGVIEEVTFRGVLLHGLHRRWRPVALVLVVGLVFGLFHVSLFRLAPTVFLGILLTGVTVMSGSIYPAVVWHVLHNATAVALGRWEVPVEALDPGGYVLGAALLATALWVAWRHRTPYPGLRGSGRRRGL